MPVSKEVYRVFFTTPRDGYKSGIIWIPRDEELILTRHLDAIGVSICIDGPTGTGKSSLALTILKKRKMNFLIIQVTKNMTWKQFCEKLLNTEVNQNNNIDLGLDIGLEKGIPIFKIHFGIKSEENSLKDLDYEDKLIERMSDHAICKILHEKKLTLVIDDFERASDEILSNVGEMCKLLTMSYISEYAKIVIIGTDDIYKRLTEFNISLEGRLKEVSLGTIDNKVKSWNFLIAGFNKLGLKHPQYEYERKYANVTGSDLQEIRVACYDAADGLLKSINELGSAIALSATGSNRVSKSTIIEVCNSYLQRNIRLFNIDFPLISKTVQQNAIAKNIVIYLYQKGIGRIHRWDEIVDFFDSQIEISYIENAICELVEIKFLTRTGYNGEILFVTNPTLAHTIGTIINNPTKYKVPKSLIHNNQIVLPYLTKAETQQDNQESQ